MLETRIKLGLTDQGRLLSAEEFAGAEFEEPYRYERMGGRLVVMSPSGLKHTQLVSAILEHLYVYKYTREEVIELIAPEGWIRISEHTDRIGDIAIYLATDGIHPDRIYETVPALMFEVVSEGSGERDYIVKRREYYDAGVREYVIVDPIRKVVIVLARGPQDYVERELRAADVYTTGHLPGFRLPLADLPW